MAVQPYFRRAISQSILPAIARCLRLIFRAGSRKEIITEASMNRQLEAVDLHQNPTPRPYGPLQLASDSIRLVHLLPGVETDLINCRTEEVTLSQVPQYFAISYTWGPPKETDIIALNGEPFSIRRNLWDLLQHFRLPHQSRTLWIDAICIDQSSIPERNAQVRIMGRIFAQAECVLVWLGEEDDGSDKAMKALRRFDHQELSPEDFDQTRRWKKEITALMRRNYWSRTWVIQELFLASQLEVHCGKTSISWRALERFANYLQALPDHTWSSRESVTDLAAIKSTFAFRLIQQKQISKVPDLIDLMELSRFSQCEDPRDRVFALLSLADRKSNGDSLVPDYSQSVVQLYDDVTRYCGQIAPEKQWQFSRMVQEMLGLDGSQVAPFLDSCTSAGVTRDINKRLGLVDVQTTYIGTISDTSNVSSCIGTFTGSDDLLFSTYDQFDTQDWEVMQEDYPLDYLETELSASTEDPYRWYDECDPLRLYDEDDPGPIFSDSIRPRPAFPSRSPYDNEDVSINVSTFINLWLLDTFRQSSRELWRLRSTQELKWLHLDQERIKDVVLEWWFKDGSVANFAVAALSPGSFDLGDHAQPHRAKSSPHLPKLHKPVPINAKLPSSPAPKTHGLQRTLEVWFRKMREESLRKVLMPDPGEDLTLAFLSSLTLAGVSSRDCPVLPLPSRRLFGLSVNTSSAPLRLLLVVRRDTFRIGLTCDDTRAGDILCQFADSNYALIVRLVGSSHEIIGKAIMVKRAVSPELITYPLTKENSSYSSLWDKASGPSKQLTWHLHALDLVI
jgi:Heterokaryon incompatibility protein (HET)